MKKVVITIILVALCFYKIGQLETILRLDQSKTLTFKEKWNCSDYLKYGDE